jgi:hypothetical protein
MPSIDFDALRSAVTLEEVVMLTGYRVHFLSGNSGRGPCPFGCGTDNRCCSLDLRGKTFRCWRCHRGGGSLDFYAALTGKEIYTASLELCRRMRVQVPFVARSKIRNPRKPRNRGCVLDAEEDGELD